MNTYKFTISALTQADVEEINGLSHSEWLQYEAESVENPCDEYDIEAESVEIAFKKAIQILKSKGFVAVLSWESEYEGKSHSLYYDGTFRYWTI